MITQQSRLSFFRNFVLHFVLHVGAKVLIIASCLRRAAPVVALEYPRILGQKEKNADILDVLDMAPGTGVEP